MPQPTSSPPELHLRSGLRLIDPTLMLRRKFDQWPWDNYDGDRVVDVHHVGSADADRANRLGARLSYAAWDRLITSKGGQIDAFLVQLPTAALEEVDLESLRVPLVGLFDVVVTKGVSISRASKVLYPFRPALLAVLDTVVEYYYWYATSIANEETVSSFADSELGRVRVRAAGPPSRRHRGSARDD